MNRDFKGNKANLPSKRCAVCGREIVWRKKWRRSWEQVRYCGERCRRESAATKSNFQPKRTL